MSMDCSLTVVWSGVIAKGCGGPHTGPAPAPLPASSRWANMARRDCRRCAALAASIAQRARHTDHNYRRPGTFVGSSPPTQLMAQRRSYANAADADAIWLMPSGRRGTPGAH